jgi:chromosomal replication initiator protein
MARGPKCPHCGGTLAMVPDRHRIMRVVSEVSGVSVHAIRGKSRLSTVAAARWAVIVMLRDLTDYSYPEIGGYLRRDHSTVMNAYRRHSQKVAVLSIIHRSREILRARGVAA